MSISKYKILLAVLDSLIIVLGLETSFWYVFASGLYNDPKLYPVYMVPSILLITTIFLIVFQLESLYKYQAITNSYRQIESLLKAYLKVMAAFILIVFFMKSDYIADSRLTIGLGFLNSFILMVFIRVIILSKSFNYLIKKNIFKKRTVIVGAGEQGQIVFKHLKNDPYSYFDIVGFCDDNQKRIGEKIYDKEVLGSSKEISKIASIYKIDEIIIAISNIGREQLLNLIDRCEESNLVTHVISDLVSKINEKMEAEEFSGLMTYRIVPQKNGIIRMGMKRGFDLIGSAVLLILTSPIFAIIALAIKKDSPGSVFYKSKVMGKNETQFFAYKFRSMIDCNVESTAEKDIYENGRKEHFQFMQNFIQGTITDQCYIKNEQRITRIGRLLRKYSLDELPQLINVFLGDMSLVGPRFCSDTEFCFYKPWHKRRFKCKPGMTGLWQVRARSEVSYDDMVMLDLYYIENWSILLDIEILLRTFSVVLFGKGSRIQ
jgi:undecaprenyl-phosphate galactose phosphotransferase